jgi:hypothetical protein
MGNVDPAQVSWSPASPFRTRAIAAEYIDMSNGEFVRGFIQGVHDATQGKEWCPAAQVRPLPHEVDADARSALQRLRGYERRGFSFRYLRLHPGGGGHTAERAELSEITLTKLVALASPMPAPQAQMLSDSPGEGKSRSVFFPFGIHHFHTLGQYPPRPLQKDDISHPVA